MIKFFVRILKFSGKYKGRVLSAAFFAFIKGICIMMPMFLGFLLFNEFYEGTISVLHCLLYFADMAASVGVHIQCRLTHKEHIAVITELTRQKCVRVRNLKTLFAQESFYVTKTQSTRAQEIRADLIVILWSLSLTACRLKDKWSLL